MITLAAALIGAATAIAVELLRQRHDRRKRAAGRRRTRATDNPAARKGPWPSND